jgi:hypothetical protein
LTENSSRPSGGPSYHPRATPSTATGIAASHATLAGPGCSRAGDAAPSAAPERCIPPITMRAEATWW